MRQHPVGNGHKESGKHESGREEQQIGQGVRYVSAKQKHAAPKMPRHQCFAFLSLPQRFSPSLLHSRRQQMEKKGERETTGSSTYHRIVFKARHALHGEDAPPKALFRLEKAHVAPGLHFCIDGQAPRGVGTADPPPNDRHCAVHGRRVRLSGSGKGDRCRCCHRRRNRGGNKAYAPPLEAANQQRRRLSVYHGVSAGKTALM